ncbi:S-layer homology domain-containing protein [Planococcus liqunii]|uniref:S-layer homology domain-containing protein n=1 Tax=Planococcus liqunii TaxID=3058394 RepID=UPI002625E316|nr:S-layer homology domain-containing protein [Planococcus sp. N056]WKA50187.1 S-layer homology domain-containing protein [Planococcus sp. N056]
MAFETKKMKKFLASTAAAAMIATAIVPAASANTVSPAAFTDVPARYATSVDYLISNNLATGLTAKQFGINENIKRGDAAIILAQALGLMDEKAPAAGFTDVPKRGAVAINSLKAAGIIKGKTKTKFGFQDKITRGEVALILSNANAYNFKGDVKALKFTDVSSRYSEAVAGLLSHGITQGTSATKYGTDNSIKRGDFAIFTYRAEAFNLGGDVLGDFRKAMSNFASVGASLGFKVVVDETAPNTFNIIGSDETVESDGGVGFFNRLAELGVPAIEVNGTEYEISDGEGNLTAEAQTAKKAIIASLLGNNTVDVLFVVPYEESYAEAEYTFNLKTK